MNGIARRLTILEAAITLLKCGKYADVQELTDSELEQIATARAAQGGICVACFTAGGDEFGDCTVPALHGDRCHGLTMEEYLSQIEAGGEVL